MVVVIVALSTESLVAVFPFAHGDTSRLIQAVAIGVATVVLLAAWGLSIKLNKSAEELEPGGNGRGQNKDRKVQ